MNILIVDDEAHIRENLGNELIEEGHDVSLSSNIEEAKEQISSCEFDCAIIDMKLDFTSMHGGLDIFIFAKEIQPNMRTIILSGYSPERLKEHLEKDEKLNSNILKQIEDCYIYKGDERSYIDLVFEKLEIKDSISSWYGNYHALLIGIQKYNDKKISDLQYPINDAIKLKNILNKYYYFDDNNLKILKNPNRHEILNELFSLSKKLTEKDNLLIFYAGHGDWSRDREQGYWIPCDGENKNPSNWISNGDIRDFLRAIKTQHTFIISDACFSGAIFKTKSLENTPKTIREKYNIKSRRAISSGDDKQSVPDRSIFLDYLINSLKINQNKYLYAQKLFTDVCDVFIYENKTDQNPVYGSIANIGDEIGGDFIFVKKYSFANLKLTHLAGQITTQN